MDINELKERIKTEHQSGHFKLQSIFDRYLDDIERLLSMGMKHRVIYDELNLGISFTHYNNIILRARKKGNKDTSITSTKNKSIAKTEKKESNIESSQNSENNDIEFWNEQLGFEINERIFNRLNNLSMSIDMIKEKNFPNAKRLSDFLIESEHKSKYKKL